MSYLTFLFASKVPGMSKSSGAVGERESAIPAAWPNAAETASSVPSAPWPAEHGLPSGIASMEHWLDLNA